MTPLGSTGRRKAEVPPLCSVVGEAEAWTDRLKCRLAGAQPAGTRRRGLVLVRLNLGHVEERYLPSSSRSVPQAQER